MYFNSDNLTLNGTLGNGTNGSGKNYIYAAFKMNPTPYPLAGNMSFLVIAGGGGGGYSAGGGGGGSDANGLDERLGGVGGGGGEGGGFGDGVEVEGERDGTANEVETELLAKLNSSMSKERHCIRFYS